MGLKSYLRKHRPDFWPVPFDQWAERYMDLGIDGFHEDLAALEQEFKEKLTACCCLHSWTLQKLKGDFCDFPENLAEYMPQTHVRLVNLFQDAMYQPTTSEEIRSRYWSEFKFLGALRTKEWTGGAQGPIFANRKFRQWAHEFVRAGQEKQKQPLPVKAVVRDRSR